MSNPDFSLMSHQNIASNSAIVEYVVSFMNGPHLCYLTCARQDNFIIT